jgi:hypothetical protein
VNPCVCANAAEAVAARKELLAVRRRPSSDVWQQNLIERLPQNCSQNETRAWRGAMEKKRVLKELVTKLGWVGVKNSKQNHLTVPKHDVFPVLFKC